MGGYPSVLVGSVSVCHFKINEQTYSRPRLRESTYHLGLSFDNHDLVDSRSEEYSLEGAKYYDTASTVRLFEPPTLDLTVNSYYKMVNLTSCHQQPPVIEHLTDLDIEQCRIRPLQLDHPCHNQCVERHVKMVTEAAAQVKDLSEEMG